MQTYSRLSQIKPAQVQELCNLLRNREVWGQLELLLGMVRQDHLESLVDPSSSVEDMVEPRTIIHFIDSLLGTVRDNLLAQEKEAKKGPSDPRTDSDQYMELSPDWTASDEPLTQ